MRRSQIRVASGVTGVLVLAAMAPAAATSGVGAKAPKVPTYTVIARTQGYGTPQMLVDSKGTVNIVWVGTKGHDQYGDSLFDVNYARKPKGSSTFKQVALPSTTNDSEFVLFQPSAGVLEMVVQPGANAISAFRSTDDGLHWSTMNASALNNSDLHNENIYPEVDQMVVAPQGLLDPTGQDSGSAAAEVQLINPALTTIAPVLLDQLGASNPWVGRTPGGVTFEVNRTGSSTPVQFQAGQHTGQLSFPTCTDGTQPSLSVGHSGAVVAEAGCGHVWATYISSAGKVGKRVTIGSAPHRVGSEIMSGQPWVDVVADRAGHYTAVFERPGGDLGVAHSSNGTKWGVQKANVPVSSAGIGIGDPSISAGSATWFATEEGGPNNEGVTVNVVRAIQLNDTYKPGSPPSGKHIRDPKKAHLGPLGVVVPGKIALRKFRKTGKTKVRLLSTLPDKVGANISDDRFRGGTDIEVCYSGRNVKLAPGKPKTVTVTCSSSVAVIGGAVGTGVAAKKGDKVIFHISSPVGTINIPTKLT